MTNGAGRISKPKTRFMAAFLRSLGEQAVAALVAQRLGDLAEHLDQVGAGAAAGVEHDHARVGQPVGDIELRAQHLVDARHHVLDDLGRRVPDAQLLAQLGVERLQEGLVEVLHGVALLEGGKEAGPVDAVERLAGPVEDLFEVHACRAAAGWRSPGRAWRGWGCADTRPPRASGSALARRWATAARPRRPRRRRGRRRGSARAWSGRSARRARPRRSCPAPAREPGAW